MYIYTTKIDLYERRVYAFDQAYMAEDFACMYDGFARAGKDEFQRWVAII